MTEIGKPPPPGEHSRRHMQENAFGALWALALVVTGCLVLNSLSQNARRDECLMRGAALCSEADASPGYRSQRQIQAVAHHVGLAAYLKGSRNW
jgi:hypothetical protein